jgi:hypothetical protein
MTNRHAPIRSYRDRLAELEYLAQRLPPESRASIERTMRLIIGMRRAVTHAQLRVQEAEQRLTHAEEIFQRLNRLD